MFENLKNPPEEKKEILDINDALRKAVEKEASDEELIELVGRKKSDMAENKAIRDIMQSESPKIENPNKPLSNEEIRNALSRKGGEAPIVRSADDIKLANAVGLSDAEKESQEKNREDIKVWKQIEKEGVKTKDEDLIVIAQEKLAELSAKDKNKNKPVTSEMLRETIRINDAEKNQKPKAYVRAVSEDIGKTKDKSPENAKAWADYYDKNIKEYEVLLKSPAMKGDKKAIENIKSEIEINKNKLKLSQEAEIAREDGKPDPKGFLLPLDSNKKIPREYIEISESRVVARKIFELESDKANVEANKERIDRLKEQLAEKGFKIADNGQIETITKPVDQKLTDKERGEKLKKLLLDEAKRLFPELVLKTDTELPAGINRATILNKHSRIIESGNFNIDDLRKQKAFSMGLSPDELSMDKYLDELKPKKDKPKSTESESVNTDKATSAQGNADKTPKPSPEKSPNHAESTPAPKKPDEKKPEDKTAPAVSPKKPETSSAARTESNLGGVESQSDPVEVFIRDLKNIKDLHEREALIIGQRKKYETAIAKFKALAKEEKGKAKNKHTPFDKKEHLNNARLANEDARKSKRDLRRLNSRLKSEGLLMIEKKWNKPWTWNKVSPRKTTQEYLSIYRALGMRGIKPQEVGQDKKLEFIDTNREAAVKLMHEKLSIGLDKTPAEDLIEAYKIKLKEEAEKRPAEFEKKSAEAREAIRQNVVKEKLTSESLEEAVSKTSL